MCCYFVRDDVLALSTTGVVLTRIEGDVIADSERFGIDVLTRGRGLRAGVDFDIAE